MAVAEESASLEDIADAWRSAGAAPAVGEAAARRLKRLFADAAAARASDVVFENGSDACQVFAIVNDRKLPLAGPMTAEEGREAAGFLFHCKDEGSSQTSYRRGSFQGFSIRAGGPVPLPAGVSALRCQRGPHEPGGDHLFARIFYSDRLDAGMTLERLGFSAAEAALFAGIRMAPHGGVFIGGTAGDGKSTTLAANLALQMAEFDGQLNLVTIEDPVEYRIPGAIQIAVPTSGLGDERAGHFKEALMHFCRVHPASGMVSEIRDADAARQVMQFIDTGHQVWTTIHVHSANAILFRLIDMGVGVAEVTKPGNVALLMKQTLLPLLCADCAQEHASGGRTAPEGLAERLAGNEAVRYRNPEGCPKCRREDGGDVAARAWNGYTEQTAIAETIRPDAGYLGHVRDRDPLGRLGLLAPGDGRRADRRQDLEPGGRGRRRSVRCPAQGCRHRTRSDGKPYRDCGGRPMTGWFRMAIPWKRAWAALVLGRKARVDCFRTIADLLESGFELERALDVTVRAMRGQGPSFRARLLQGWRRALVENRFPAAMAATAPPAEAMIFQAYGRIDADVLFAAAARVADLRERQISAIRKALAMPLTLAGGLAVMLWAAGGYFVPVLESVVPPERWGPAAGLFRAASAWLYAEPLIFCAICAAIVAGLSGAMVYWTGPGRTTLDRVAPFSLYRTITGSAFLFVALEYLAAGLDLNDQAFEDLKRHASPYARHRIAAIQHGMARGAGFGRAMALAGHGFPDPALVPVAAALDGAPGWEKKLAGFVERWVGRSEDLLKSRAAALNGLLLIAVTVAMAAGIDAMFSVLQLAGRP